MSKQSYTNYGVPWYCDSDYPPIRPRDKETDKEWWLEGKKQQMKARQFVINFIKTNWKTGDRFVFDKSHDDLPEMYSGNAGTFLELKLVGSSWRVSVKWDDTNFKPTGVYNNCGMFAFYWGVSKIYEFVI